MYYGYLGLVCAALAGAVGLYSGYGVVASGLLYAGSGASVILAALISEMLFEDADPYI
ncbi:MAG: hypothetical protein OXQ92_02320 [Boseongicola sp.]|nr:hypothetical protein [Boseongicola sp.]MDD9977563.1 hypothetical protein [Boseongicola sp.]